MRCGKCGTEAETNFCPKCGAQMPVIPIPASFFSPEEATPRHTFTLSDEPSASGGFTITTDSLTIEAVTEPPKDPLPDLGPLPESPAALPKKPQPPRDSAAGAPPVREKPAERPSAPVRPRTVDAAQVPTPEGFYMVPYDESLWAMLSRFRHRWLLPILVGMIFVGGMITGVMMTRSALRNKQNADSAEPSAQEQTAEESAPAGEPLSEAEMLEAFAETMLPDYGYLSTERPLSYSETDGWLSGYSAGGVLTLLRLEDGRLHIINCEGKNGTLEAAEEAVYGAFLKDAAVSDAVMVYGDAKGIYLDDRAIADVGLGIADDAEKVALCSFCKANRADDYQAVYYQISDETGIREKAPGLPDAWKMLYARLLNDSLSTLASGSQGGFRLLYIDDDDVPELELRVMEMGALTARLFTVSGGTVRELTPHSEATGYVCIPRENCFREASDGSDGTYYHWFHLENGMAVSDRREWIGEVDGERVYQIEDQTYPFEEYEAHQPPETQRLEDDPELTALTADDIEKALK